MLRCVLAAADALLALACTFEREGARGHVFMNYLHNKGPYFGP